jgi:hypothetical protein
MKNYFLKKTFLKYKNKQVFTARVINATSVYIHTTQGLKNL